MKKALISLIIVCISVALFSCIGNKRIPVYENDVFFSEDVMLEYEFEGLPIPSFESSRMDIEKNNVLYLNMTDEQFEDYRDAVVQYLLEREGIYNLGVWYDVRLFVGPMFIPIVYDSYIPLVDNINDLSDTNKFAFSLKEELTYGWISGLMVNAYEIEVSRINGTLDGEEAFEYNTYISIDNARAVYEPCSKEHKYGEARSYPLPNSDLVIDIYHCVYCGSEIHSEYFAGGDNTWYKKRILTGANYLERSCFNEYAGDNPGSYAGLEQDLKILKQEGVEFKVRVNGFEIPVAYEEDGCLIYGFIMPQCDVEIEINIVEETEQ